MGKKDNYLDLARELKKLWNMKVTVIPIVIGALVTVTKVLVQGLEDLEIREIVKTIQMTALLRLAKILRRILGIGLMSRVFTNGPGDWGSVLGQIIPKTQKLLLDATLLNTQHYKVRVKWSNPGNGVVPSPTPWCGSY